MAVLRQAEAVEKVSELRGRLGISEARFRAMGDELRKVRQFHEVNDRLKRLVVDLRLD